MSQQSAEFQSCFIGWRMRAIRAPDVQAEKGNLDLDINDILLGFGEMRTFALEIDHLEYATGRP